MSNIFRQCPSSRIVSNDLIRNNPIPNEFWEPAPAYSYFLTEDGILSFDKFLTYESRIPSQVYSERRSGQQDFSKSLLRRLEINRMIRKVKYYGQDPRTGTPNG